jgi:hypothetical protein
VSLTHWVGRGTGTPKDKDEGNKREVYECEGSSGLVGANSSPGQTLKKPKYLSVCDREEGDGRGRPSRCTQDEKKNFVYYESMKRKLI